MAHFILSQTRPAKRHVLASRLADLAQPGMAGKPEDVAAAPVFEQIYDLGRGVMATAAYGDPDVRPVAPDAAHDAFEDARRLFPGRPLAGTQQGEQGRAPACPWPSRRHAGAGSNSRRNGR